MIKKDSSRERKTHDNQESNKSRYQKPEAEKIQTQIPEQLKK